MAEVLSSRRSHGHVRWFDERLGESPAWGQFTKNTFIDIDPDEDEVEDKSAFRRQRSAPARALGLKATSRMTPREHEEMVEAARMAVAATSSWGVVWCNAERSLGNTRSSHKGCRSRGPSTGCSSRSGRSSGPSSRRSSVCPKSKRRQSKRRTACPIILTGSSKPRRPSSRRNSGNSSGISSGPSSRRSSVISCTPGSNSVTSSRAGSGRRRSSLSAKRLTSGKLSKKLSSKSASKNEATEKDQEFKPGQNTEADTESSESEQSDTEPIARKRRERMSAVVWTRFNDRPRTPEVKVSNRYAALESNATVSVAKVAPEPVEAQCVSVDMDLDEVELNKDTPMVPDQAMPDVVPAREYDIDTEQTMDASEGQVQCESNSEDLKTLKEELREEPHASSSSGSAIVLETAALQDDLAETARGESSTIPVEQQSDEPAQLSKHARKRAQKKFRKATDETSQTKAESNTLQSCDVNAESVVPPEPPDKTDTQAELSQKQSQMLAQLAVRLNEQHIAMHLRACSARRLLLATPVNPLTRSCDEMLQVEPGDVIHCEMADPSGWGFGTIVAPLRLSGNRGCFHCDSMCPITVEVRSNRDGDTLEFTPGKWTEVAVSQNGNTKNRLREKAALNRIRIAQRNWAKKFGNG